MPDYEDLFHISGRKVMYCCSDTTATKFSFYIVSRYLALLAAEKCFF